MKLKKKLMLFAVMVMLSLLVIAQTAQAATLLKIGTSGPTVLTLQTDLKKLGYDPGPVDGIYGVKTKAAVLAFQQSAKLQADGIYGPLTQQALTQALELPNDQTQAILLTAKTYIGVPY